MHHCEWSTHCDPRWQSTALDHTQYVMTHQSPSVVHPCQQKKEEGNNRERERGGEIMRRRINEEDEEKEGEEADTKRATSR